MEHSELLSAVWKMLDWSSRRDAPTTFDAPDGTGLQELVAEISRRVGRHRNLVAGGFTDPSLTERTGLPLVEPFGEELLEMRGWAYRSHWIGCGRVASPEGGRTVVVVGHREDPAAVGFPEGASWAEKLRILTGWEPGPRPAVDWSAAEAALGTALPSDYKEIVDLFGEGSFDEYVDLLVPGAVGMDLVKWVENDVKHTTGLWHPYAAYPAPGGCCAGERRKKRSTSSGRRVRPTPTTGPFSSSATSVSGNDLTAAWVSSSSACSRTCSSDFRRVTSGPTTS
ncbi:hypothetical protein GCM10020367_08690 [Streptomyces sannanensis]|uniref:Knr4/Smi1-like domain-containing protein n=1 Tax=Streptomyces sannanensis TaxID=285536 RepID=A0ABP6S5V8_9ACTN